MKETLDNLFESALLLESDLENLILDESDDSIIEHMSENVKESIFDDTFKLDYE